MHHSRHGGSALAGGQPPPSRSGCSDTLSWACAPASDSPLGVASLLPLCHASARSNHWRLFPPVGKHEYLSLQALAPIPAGKFRQPPLPSPPSTAGGALPQGGEDGVPAGAVPGLAVREPLGLAHGAGSRWDTHPAGARRAGSGEATCLLVLACPGMHRRMWGTAHHTHALGLGDRRPSHTAAGLCALGTLFRAAVAPRQRGCRPHGT